MGVIFVGCQTAVRFYMLYIYFHIFKQSTAVYGSKIMTNVFETKKAC